MKQRAMNHDGLNQRRPKQRGLTLIETLLSLALLGTILIVSVSWTRVVAQSGMALVEPAQWERDAFRVLDLIADDLEISDFSTSRRRGKPRVEVRAPDLVVTTRNALDERRGTVEHRYHRDPARNILELEERAPGASGPRRSLLEGVQRWNCSINEEEQTVEVTIGRNDLEVSRRYRLP